MAFKFEDESSGKPRKPVEDVIANDAESAKRLAKSLKQRYELGPEGQQMKRFLGRIAQVIYKLIPLPDGKVKIQFTTRSRKKKESDE